MPRLTEVWVAVLVLIPMTGLALVLTNATTPKPQPPVENGLNLRAADFLHIYLGGTELRVPNYGEVSLGGPEAPEKASYSYAGPRVERILQSGEILKFSPFLGTQPYRVTSLHFSKPYQTFASYEDSELLEGITNILIREVHQDWDGKRSPVLSWDESRAGGVGYNAVNLDTNSGAMFGQTVIMSCANLSSMEPEASWCKLYGRMPAGQSIRLSIKVNYSGRESWESFDQASEAWPARLNAVEKLLLSFHTKPTFDH